MEEKKEEKLSCGHSTLSVLLFRAISRSFNMLASLCSLAIFEKPDHSDAWAVQTMVPTVLGLYLKGEAE